MLTCILTIVYVAVSKPDSRQIYLKNQSMPQAFTKLRSMRVTRFELYRAAAALVALLIR